jgi:CBS domain-containing protein
MDVSWHATWRDRGAREGAKEKGMARVVREIMNHELFALAPDARSDHALAAILRFGSNALPVVDADPRPIGVTSLRDLVRGGRELRYSSPAASVSLDTPITEAARIMAERRYHQLVVVASDGRPAGMVSSGDLLRALLGLPADRVDA